MGHNNNRSFAISFLLIFLAALLLRLPGAVFAPKKTGNAKII